VVCDNPLCPREGKPLHIPQSKTKKYKRHENHQLKNEEKNNYCSVSCRIAHNAMKNTPDAKCLYCGDDFKRHEGKKYYHSQQCRHAYEKEEGYERGYGSQPGSPSSKRVLNNIAKKIEKGIANSLAPKNDADIIREWLDENQVIAKDMTAKDIKQKILSATNRDVLERSISSYRIEIGINPGKTIYTWDYVNDSIMCGGDILYESNEKLSNIPFTTRSNIVFLCGRCKKRKEKNLGAYLYDGADGERSPYCRDCNRKIVGEKNRIHQTGRKHSQQSKDKMAKIMTGRNHTWGDKISKSLKGKVVSSETRQKQRQAKLGKPSKRKRPVKNITTGIVFDSVTFAAKIYNVHPQGIRISIKKGIGCRKCYWSYL
jgi:hypothetical protein